METKDNGSKIKTNQFMDSSKQVKIGVIFLKIVYKIGVPSVYIWTFIIL